MSSGYPFCSEELCIRFLCQELSAPNMLLSEVPPSGNFSEELTVFVSTGSAVDERFAWLSNDSLKHTPEGLVMMMIIFFFYNLYWGLIEQNTKLCCSVAMAKPPHLHLNKTRAPDQLLPSLPSSSPLQRHLLSTCYVPALHSQVFRNALIYKLLSQLLKHKQLLMCQTFIV